MPTLSLLSPLGSQQQESVMSLCKFLGDNLAEDLMPPETWRMTFKFLSIMELVRLRQVCSTFKDEVDFLFGRQDKLGIFDPFCVPMNSDLCSDPRYYIPDSSWIRLNSLRQHLPTLKSLFPSVKVLVMNSSCIYELYIEDILDSFVDLESLAIDNDDTECRDTDQSYPKLKHLFLGYVYRTELVFLPSLESLRIQCDDFSELEPWMEKNFGRPSKRLEIDYPFSEDPDYSLQCLSSLPSSLEYLKFRDFFGYSRQFKPMFPKLMEVDRVNVQEYREDDIVDYGHTQFINFLKDHTLTLKKVTTHLEQMNDEQLKDMLSCLLRGTHINISLPEGLERADYVRQLGLIGGLCRDRNFYLEIDAYDLRECLDNPNRFLDILPPETQSLTLWVSKMTFASCRRLILEILSSPLRSTILYFDQTEESKRTCSAAIQGLPETHEAILEWFYAKPKRLIIRRRN